MTTNRRTTASTGGAEICCIGARAIELRMYGHLSRRILDGCLHEAAEVMRQHPEIHTAVWNFSGLVGYDPGNPAVAIRWAQDHMSTFTQAIVVTRSHVVAGLVRVGQVMIPWIKAEVVARREDVPALLDELQRGRRPNAA